MNELYPIVRRKRRPLLEADASPVVVETVVRVEPVAIKPVETVLTEEQPQTSDGKITSKRSAR